MRNLGVHEFGWCADLPDHRDFSPTTDRIAAALANLKPASRKNRSLPAAVDWRAYCGPIDDQLGLATGPAHACAALLQYCQRRATGRLVRPSRLFLHQVAARAGDAAVGPPLSLRTVLKSAARCGAPPERYWRYDATNLERQPDAFTYAYARNYRGLQYLRLDRAEQDGLTSVDRVRSFVAAGFPVALGFSICTCLGAAAEIPFPTAADSVLGGEAVVAIGYNDAVRIRSARGALLIRCSWGMAWGENGYGWLPYDYLTRRLAVDCWTIFKPSWLRSGEFARPFHLAS